MSDQKSCITGLIAAPFTPMAVDGQLDLSIIPDYFSMLKSNGVAGVFICGSTGEGPSLTQAERMKVVAAWQACASDDPSFAVIVLVGGNSVEECSSLATFSEHAGVDAISFAAPSYFKPATVDVLAECCRTVASHAPGTPFYYYHIPALTAVQFPMLGLLERVHGLIPNFRGIKYTHEDFMDYLSCRHFKGGMYDILWGRDETFLAALSCGAEGAVGSTFNYAAPLYLQLWKAFRDNDLLRARHLQQQSIDMIQLLGKYGGLGVGKAFMKAIGMDCGNFRLPVTNPNPASYEAFLKDLLDIGFRQFCSRVSSYSKL
jgi:N-acetylneuraminate lyase